MKIRDGFVASTRSVVLIASGLIAAGCDPPLATEADGETLVIDFEAVADPPLRRIEIVEAFGRTARGLVPIRVVQDGLPNVGPPNSVELVTEWTGFDADCGFASSYCGSVRVRSFYATPLDNVFSQLISITPFAGHEPLNSDPPQQGLTNTYGLWGYGSLQANGGNNSRLWVFNDDGQAFRFRGRIMGDIVRRGRLLVITGAGGSPSSLYRVDETTGRAVLVAPTPLTHLGGIDVDPTTGTVFVHRNTFAGPQELYRIDPATGALTLAGATNIQAPDLTFDNAGVLYAWASFGLGAMDDLARIDEITGAVELIASPLAGSRTGLFTRPDGTIAVKNGNTLLAIDTGTGIATALGEITGIPGSSHSVADVDPTTGYLYTVLRSPLGTDLYRVDLATRAATLVGPIRDGFMPIFGVSGLAFE